MVSVFLTILKILVLVLLCILGTALLLVCLVLFVPVRYRVRVCREEKPGGDIPEPERPAPLEAALKVTWLLHLVSVSFSWPENAFLRVRLLGIGVFRSDRSRKKDAAVRDKPSGKAKAAPNEAKPSDEAKSSDEVKSSGEPKPSDEVRPSGEPKASGEDVRDGAKEGFRMGEQAEPEKGLWSRLWEFLHKLLSLFQNIRYTIARICDKIKDIVNNIQYYLKILKSDTFRRAWSVCSGEALSLLRSILPGKVSGRLTIGTGDPAGTGQVFALYGILYPLAGSHIDVTPDFERRILEGELLVKGKITVFKAVKTAWRIYFNRDLRRLIKLLKREAA